VPLGGILAAVIAPAVATAYGWRWALVVSALMTAALIPLIEMKRADWDDDREPASPVLFNPLGGIVSIWRHRALRYMSIAGACLVVPQFAISTFTVVLFVEEMGYTLVAAGIVLTASQVAGVAGRIFWGWLSDIMRNCYTVLSILSVVMLGAALLCLALTPNWPIALACLLFFVFGSTASGWNGAFLAEVARLTPRHEVSKVTGGSLFFVNIGKMLGPIAVANAYVLTGSYIIAFALLAVPTLVALACLLGARSIAR
jgi:predicted MFS family arabinose efflux permease